MGDGSPSPQAALPHGLRALAALIEPFFAPGEGPGRPGLSPFLSSREQLLEGSAVLLRCLVVLADEQVTAEEEAHLVSSVVALFADDEAVLFLRRVLQRLREDPLDPETLGALLRHAYAERTRKLMLLLALEAAYADGSVQEEEGELIRHLQGSLGIADADGDILQIVAGGDPLRSLGHILESDARREALRGLHGDLSPSGFAALRGCPGLHQTLRRAHAALDELVRALDGASGRTAPAPELDEDLHAALLHGRNEVQSLSEHLVQLRIAAGAPELALAGGVLKALGEVHRRLATDGPSVAVLGEFDVGKSTLLDALLAEDLLPTGGAPTTAALTLVRFGPERQLTARYRSRPNEEVTLVPARFDERTRLAPTSDFDAADEALDGLDLEQLTVSGPFPFCRSGVRLVDTPGLNEVARRTALSMRFVRESDLAVVLSNATEPFGASVREMVSRLLDDRPTAPVLLAVTHWDHVTEADRASVQARYEEHVRALGPRGGRVVLRFVSAAKALSALRQRPVPEGDPWLSAFHGFRREMLTWLARVRMPKQLERLRAGLRRAAEETHGLGAVRLEQLAGRDVAGAERDLHRLRQASAALGAELTAAGDQFSADVADRCAQFVDAAVVRLGPVAERWESPYDPRWPGNTARIRAAFEQQAQLHFERCLHDWFHEQVPTLLAATLGGIETRHAESLAVVEAALGPLRGGATARGTSGPPPDGGLLTLARVAGRWSLLGPDGSLDVSWRRIGAALAAEVGQNVVADLLGRSGQMTAAIEASVGLALLLRGKDNLVEKVRAGLMEAVLGDRPRIVQAVRASCVEAAGDGFRDLSGQIHAGLRSLVESGESRLAMVREAGRSGAAQQQRLKRAQAACASVSRALAAPAAARHGA